MKATIHQGIINVPVKLTPTITESYYGTGFNQFHIEDNGSVGYVKICKKCNKELKAEDITKGYMVDRETAVVFSKEELSALDNENNYMIELLGFKRLSDKELINTLVFARKSYFVDTADKKVAGIFQMFKSAIEQEGVVSAVKLTNRNCEHLGYLLVSDKILYFVELPFNESKKGFELEDYKVKESDVELSLIHI